MPRLTIEQAIEDTRAGKMVILTDDEDRENEGDLTMAAEKITPDAINFMTKYGRGLVCLSLTPEKIDARQIVQQPFMRQSQTMQSRAIWLVRVIFFRFGQGAAA